MEARSTASKRPACENCKNRKTKCDRGSPCSSCVTAELECRISHRAAEKRQRVLISTRYDEAMENVDRSLQDVSQMLQKLLDISERPSPPSRTSPATVSSGQISDAPGISEGYRGESSFKAHVQSVTTALRDAASKLEYSTADSTLSDTMHATDMIQQATNSAEKFFGLDETPSPLVQVQYPELENRPLPPSEHALKLVRLAQTQKQRFFTDIPIFDEQEFAELCQKIYFAINDYSIMSWIIVNTGLFYLFAELPESYYDQVGITASDIDAHTRLLTTNIEAAIQSIRLCQDPTVESCQALAALSGRSAVAWTLISAAARMCIDLGLHRLPNDSKSADTFKKRKVFWHVYVWDQGMAFTLGRTPTIHQYDISTERPSLEGVPAIPEYLIYAGIFGYAAIAGEMHLQLFSAVAQRESHRTRTENAKSFALRLTQINDDIKQLIGHDSHIDDMFESINMLMDIIMHCLITIAYRVIPSDGSDSNPLKCNDDCVRAARQALGTIVRAYDTFGKLRPSGWTRFLNILFSLVPFACFVVLAGNTVASKSSEDLELMSAVLSAIKPIASVSLSCKKLVDVCSIFHQLASVSVARETVLLTHTAPPTLETNAVCGDRIEEGILGQMSDPMGLSSEHIMAPQDWDTVMNEFDLGIDASAMASFIEPYMPFDGRLS